VHHGRAKTIAAGLASWFQAVARDLSFRRTRDPYAVWVSEIMLQQTRVDTVEGYFPRFMQRFPDVHSLAAASEDDVLGAWSGLGYYRRARLLHRGARWLVEHHRGQLPRGAAALREIPGVGAYTAGAISSIAFGDPEPLVDGNVARVLSRLEGVEDPREQVATANRHWRDAADIIGHGEPRVLAQALMELGAMVCTPRAPRCDECPVAAKCVAKARGLVDVIPAVKVKKASPTLHWIALAFDVGEGGAPSWLLVRRPEEGLLARMWTLPLVPSSSADEATSASKKREGGEHGARGEVIQVLQRLAGGRKIDRATWAGLELHECAPVKHVFTHQTWQMSPWIVRGLSVADAEAITSATGAEELATFGEGAGVGGGLPTLTRRLLEAIAAAEAGAGAKPTKVAQTKVAQTKVEPTKDTPKRAKKVKAAKAAKGSSTR
jgi:A/G-specific adenine glycosylase